MAHAVADTIRRGATWCIATGGNPVQRKAIKPSLVAPTLTSSTRNTETGVWLPLHNRFTSFAGEDRLHGIGAGTVTPQASDAAVGKLHKAISPGNLMHRLFVRVMRAVAPTRKWVLKSELGEAQ